MDILKKRVKQILWEKGMRINDLAAKMGKAQSTVSNLLASESPSLERITEIADALGVSAADLISEEEAPEDASYLRRRVSDLEAQLAEQKSINNRYLGIIEQLSRK